MWAVAAGAAAYAAKRTAGDELCERKIPLMGVLGSFVFAAQMINFTIPMTGSSGHIGGGILLAALLGACPSFLTVVVILAIQCLFFADGGLLALGGNIVNLGLVPCLVVYPLVYRPIAERIPSPRRITAASILGVVVSLQLGAFLVVLETLLSGVAELPFSAFLMLMQPIHLAIGVVEGIVTASILCFVYASRPEIIEGAASQNRPVSRAALPAFAAAALLVGGALSSFASGLPDGLEWAVGKIAGSPELEAAGVAYEQAAEIQGTTAIMPGYAFASEGAEGAENSPSGTPVAGVTGGVITFLTIAALGGVISRFRARRAHSG